MVVRASRLVVLVSLDQHANRDPVKVDLEIRIQEILQCFPDMSGISVIMILYVNASLVANDWRELLEQHQNQQAQWHTQ